MQCLHLNLDSLQNSVRRYVTSIMCLTTWFHWLLDSVDDWRLTGLVQDSDWHVRMVELLV